MIKADIINQVAEDAAITKVKAVEAVEAVFEAMKTAMQRGERIEFAWLRGVSGQATQEGHRPQPTHRPRGAYTAGKDDSFQTGKELAQPVLSRDPLQSARSSAISTRTASSPDTSISNVRLA